MNGFILLPLGIILLILGLIAIASVYDIQGTKWYSRLYWYYYRLFFGKKYKDASASFIYAIILIIMSCCIDSFIFSNKDVSKFPDAICI